MLVRRERAAPEASDQQRIDAIALRIRPDDVALADWYDTYRIAHRERLAFDLGYVREFTSPGARILDVGAVPPILCGALKGLGYDVTGIDIAPDRFERVFRELGIPAKTCDIETDVVPLDDGWADAVILHEVFEHLRIDLVSTCRELARVVKPGGRLLLSTPNLTSLPGMTNLIFRGRAQSCGADPYTEFSKLQSLGHMGHVREYTTVEVCEFLARFGFRTEVLIFRGRTRRLLEPVCRLIPRLRPFFEVVATRVE